MFEAEGCNNCSHVDPKIWNAGEVNEMTTSIFSGYVILLKIASFLRKC